MYRDDPEAPTYTKKETDLEDHEPSKAFHSRGHINHCAMAQSFQHTNPAKDKNESYYTKEPKNKHLATRALDSTHVSKHTNQASNSER
jgi:hypothetical protein